MAQAKAFKMLRLLRHLTLLDAKTPTVKQYCEFSIQHPFDKLIPRWNNECLKCK